MRTAALVIVVLLASLPVYAQSQDQPIHAMSKTEFRSFLEALGRDLPRLRESLQKVDVASLRVAYAEGKLIDDQKDEALRALDLVQQSVAAVTERPALVRQIGLLSFIQDLEARTLMLEMSLTGLLSSEQLAQDSPKAVGWSDEISAADRQIARAEKKLFNHLLGLADAIDSTIDVPKMLR
jgi:hypothetical protein